MVVMLHGAPRIYLFALHFNFANRAEGRVRAPIYFVVRIYRLSQNLGSGVDRLFSDYG